MLARSQRVLVETLRDLGCLDETQTDNLMKESNVSGSELEKLLIDRFKTPPDPMLLAKAKAYKISPIKLEKFKVNEPPRRKRRGIGEGELILYHSVN